MTNNTQNEPNASGTQSSGRQGQQQGGSQQSQQGNFRDSRQDTNTENMEQRGSAADHHGMSSSGTGYGVEANRGEGNNISSAEE